MAEKISVYVDKDLHRTLKTAAAQRGKTLSQFMLDAALRSLHASDRKAAGTRMDQIRKSQTGSFSSEELLDMRNKGRRY